MLLLYIILNTVYATNNIIYNYNILLLKINSIYILFKGHNCNILNPCASNPCENGGTCTSTATGYSCSCPPSHTGERCHEAVESNTLTTFL